MVEKITNIKENEKYNKKNIQEYANNKLDQHIDNLQSYIDEFKEKFEPIYSLEKNSNIFEHLEEIAIDIENKDNVLKDLKALRQASSKLSLFKKYYITDNIYFSLWLYNSSPAHEYKIVGQFYENRKTTNIWRYKVSSLPKKLNDIFNTVLTGILSILLQNEDLIDMSWTLGNKNRSVKYLLNDLIDLSSKLEEIFENKNSWQFKLLQDTANNIVKNVL